MDLNLVQEIALSLSAVVMSLCGSVAACNKVYNDIYKGMRERKLNEISVERARLDLEKEQIEFLRQSCVIMADTLHVPDVEKLHAMSGNELRTLKMLLSVFRRVRVLARYQEEGLAQLPSDDDQEKSGE